MNIELTSLFIALCPLLATLLVWAVAALCLRRYIDRKATAAADATEGLPDAGQSLRKTIVRLDLLCRIQAIFLIALPLVLAAAYGALHFSGQSSGSLWEFALIVSSAVLLVLLCLLKLVRTLRLRRQIKLAYEGKQLAAQALEPLMEQGYFIFHDFMIEQIHIDHLIVGPKGVFCIQTQPRGAHDAASTVTYNGRALFFPKGEDYLPIEQANRHAEWISAWVSQFLEEPIAARAILAMPGWTVKRTSADGIPVVNPSQFASLFKHIHARPLSESAIRNMVTHIERKYPAAPLAQAG